MTIGVHRVLLDVHRERGAQDRKFGVQRHPNGTSESYRKVADEARALTQRRADDGTVTWVDILHEEVLEAFAETATRPLRAELVQIAAVAVAWVEDLDSQGGEQ